MSLSIRAGPVGDQEILSSSDFNDDKFQNQQSEKHLIFSCCNTTLLLNSCFKVFLKKPSLLNVIG